MTEQSTKDAQPGNPLHGVTLEMMLHQLVARYGWEALGREINIRCFNQDPSIASSLKFLRRTPWARQRVEALFVDMGQPGQTMAGESTGKPE